jgi:hypothetical protein
LDEVRARHGHFSLVFPAPAELPDRAGQDRTGLGIDEQLRQAVLRHPFRIVRRDRHDIGGFARDRNLPRPGQRRPAVLASQERPAIFRHLGLGQVPQHRSRQHPLDEHVAVENHRFALIGAKALEDRRRRRAPFLPAGDRPHDRLHIGDAADTVAMTIGPVEA